MSVCVCVQVFHRYFNYFWLGLPKFLFPRAGAALASLLVMPDTADLLSKRDLSPYLRIAIDLMLSNGQSETDIKVGLHASLILQVGYTCTALRLVMFVIATTYCMM